MRKTLGLVMVLALLTGCPDKEAEQRMVVNAKYKDALAQFEKAHRDFADYTKMNNGDALVDSLNVTVQGTRRSDGTTYNLAELDKAEKQLQAVLSDSTASKVQKMSCAQMLAQIHSAHAQQLARDAKISWAKIEDVSAALTTNLISLQLNDGLVRLNAPNLQPIIQQLEQNRQDAVTDRDQRQADADALAGKIKTLEGDVDRLNKERADLIKQSQELEVAAVNNKDRDAGHKQELRAVELAHEAEKRANAVQDLEEVKLNVFRAEHKFTSDEITHLNKGIAALDEQIAAAKFQQGKSGELAQSKRESRNAAVIQVENDYKQLTDSYVEEVAKPLGEANNRMNQAIDAIGKAIANAGGASRDARKNLQADRLTLRMTQARILSLHLTYLGSVGSVTGALATHSTNLIPDKADFFKASYQTHFTEQNKLKTETDKVFTEAESAIAEASETGLDDIKTLATRQSQTLAGYRAQLAGDGIMLPQDPGTVRKFEPIDVPTPIADKGDTDDPGTTDDPGDPDIGAPAGPLVVPDVQVTGDMPAALPAFAYNSQFNAYFVIDFRHLTPKKIEATTDNLLGPSAAEFKAAPGYAAQMNEAYAAIAKLVEAGVVGVAIAGTPDPNAAAGGAESETAAQLIMFAVKEGTDSDAVKAALSGIAPAEATFSQAGNWLVATEPPGKAVPDGADPQQQQLATAALARMANKPVSFMIINDDKAKAMVGQAAQDNPQAAELSKLTESVAWTAGSIDLDNLTIDTISKMGSADDATQAKGAIDQAVSEFSKSLSGPESPLGPFLGPMVAGSIGQAIKPSVQGDELNLTLDIKPLKPAIVPLLMMGMQAGGPGPGGPGGEIPPDFGADPDFDPSK